MKTKAPLGPQIDVLLKQGLPSQVIAERLGCRLHYVQVIKSYGGYVQRKQRVKADYYRRNGGVPCTAFYALRRIETALKHAAIIAAVDDGMSYTQAAKAFGLKSRNVVAGIMYRRPEAGGQG